MIDKSVIGKVLLYWSWGEVQVSDIQMCRGEECCFVNRNYPENPNGCYEIWNEAELKRVIDSQDKQRFNNEQRIIRLAKEKAEEERQAEAQRAKEDLYGFGDNLLPMQKKRVLNCLMKQYRYDGVVMTRKEFVVTRINRGYYLDIKTFDNQGRRAKNEFVTVNMLCHPTNNTFSEITKTEYDFATYLIANKVAAQAG